MAYIYFSTMFQVKLLFSIIGLGLWQWWVYGLHIRRKGNAAYLVEKLLKLLHFFVTPKEKTNIFSFGLLSHIILLFIYKWTQDNMWWMILVLLFKYIFVFSQGENWQTRTSKLKLKNSIAGSLQYFNILFILLVYEVLLRKMFTRGVSSL